MCTKNFGARTIKYKRLKHHKICIKKIHELKKPYDKRRSFSLCMYKIISFYYKTVRLLLLLTASSYCFFLFCSCHTDNLTCSQLANFFFFIILAYFDFCVVLSARTDVTRDSSKTISANNPKLLTLYYFLFFANSVRSFGSTFFSFLLHCFWNAFTLISRKRKPTYWLCHTDERRPTAIWRLHDFVCENQQTLKKLFFLLCETFFFFSFS